MAELLLHKRPVRTVFDLLGDKEDDITYSLGWALAISDALGSQLLSVCFAGEHSPADEVTALRLQESVPGAGRTDVEIETARVHLVLEAKRGWNLPTVEQLSQYAARFTDARAAQLLVVAECSPQWASPRLPSEVHGIPVRYSSWQKISDLVAGVADAATSNAEKRLLREFVRYLRGLMTLQDPTSNMVYVVALGQDNLFASGVSFKDIVVDYDRYFHPVGGGRSGWPKTPPNHLGFRFDGKLQQIRHVDGYEVHDDPWNTIAPLAGKTDWPPEPHFFYELGPVIEPNHVVRTGRLWPNGRVWAALDLLLTCETVTEARDKTNARLAEAGAASA